ncbi:MAG: PorT family protein [Paludibacteraceae bacterium]|nr:PorT family protein [Paludibacteraceae bacterium]
MKKFLLAVATALLCISSASAQDEFMWGLTGGLNVSGFSGDYRSESFNHGTKAGFNIGLKAEYEIAEPFFIEGAFALSGKGFSLGYSKEALNDPNLGDVLVANRIELDSKNKVDLWYLHIPFNFGYKFEINDYLAVAPKVGVYIDLGLWGSDSYDNNPFTDYDNWKDNIYFENNVFNRFDFGFGFGANFWAAQHFELSTGYEMGMVKAYKAESKPRNWYLNLAFLF